MENYSKEDIERIVGNSWEETEKESMHIWTGIEGALNFWEEISKKYGKPWTPEERARHKQDLLNSGQKIFKL